MVGGEVGRWTEVAQRQSDAAAFGDSSSWEGRKGGWVVRKGGKVLISKAAVRQQASTPFLEHRWRIRTDFVHDAKKRENHFTRRGNARLCKPSIALYSALILRGNGSNVIVMSLKL